MNYALLILAIPFILFFVLAFGSKKMNPKMAGIIGTCGTAVIAVLAYMVAISYFSQSAQIASGELSSYVPQLLLKFEWLRFTDKLAIELGVLLDPISVLMLVVITTISLMVHIYSLGYMKGERGFNRYYAFLSLFGFSMLGLVVATNIFQMYIFWELVGVSSYLLISFYYTKPSAVAASKKAFIVTRFADLGFLVGILILSYFTGTFDFATLSANNAELVVNSTAGTSFMGLSVAAWALGLIFMGGAGKSAMFPMHLWLPDAMEGPTPASALIHAATMVVAGIYLVARLFTVYFFAAPEVLTMIAYIGAFTAIFAASIALVQTDIKRVLAFSTISQLAFMMTALGVSGYGDHDGVGYMASLFHLFTHAFFKALLFLGAGSVIHAVHSNEMKDMGGLRKYMPITNITFLIACLAIAGIWPFSGFFSKDEVMAAAFASNKVVFFTLWVTAGLTAFYMFRLYFNIFWNKDKDYGDHKPHESPKVITIPLIILAVFSIFAGFTPFSKFISNDGKPFDIHINPVVASLSIAVAVIGIAIAAYMYMKAGRKLPKEGAAHRALSQRLYIDNVWMSITQSVVFKAICSPIAWFDRHVVDGAMNGLAWVTQKASVSIRGWQSGQVQAYAWFFLVGVLAIAVLSLLVF